MRKEMDTYIHKYLPRTKYTWAQTVKLTKTYSCKDIEAHTLTDIHIPTHIGKTEKNRKT